MILVTAAGGKASHSVIEALRARGVPVRAMARSEGIRDLYEDGVDAYVGDMLDRRAVEDALDGVDGVVHIGPTFNPQEVAMGRTVIDAAVAKRTPRFLQFSVYHPHLDALVNHRTKLVTENYLVNSGLDYTILQPMHYMQAYDPRKIAADGVLQVPYDTTMKRSYVDLADVAEVAARALTEDGHVRAVYPLSGAELLSSEEVAATIGARAGVEVRVEELSVPRFVEMLSAGGEMSSYTVEGIHRLMSYYSLHPLTGNANVLRWALGREPGTVADYVDRCFTTDSSPPPPRWPDNNRLRS